MTASSDLAVPAASNGALAPPVITAGGLPGLAVLEQWVTAASAASRLVEPLIASAFVPDAYKPRVPANADDEQRAAAWRTALGNATSAVLLGMSLGVDPLTALQNIYIVHGRPGMYSKFKAALAQAAGHEVWVAERSAESVTVCGRRKGWAPDRVATVTITIEDARTAGWFTNDLYKKTPADMLQWRATGRVVDQIAPDVLAGIASVEDLDDIDQPTPVTQSAIGRALTKAADVPRSDEQALAGVLAAAERHDPEVAPAPASDVAPVVEGASQPLTIEPRTWNAINGRFVQLGGRVNGPGQQAARLYVIGRMVGRTVERGGDLTAAEGDLVLSTLQGTTRQRVDALLDERGFVEPGGQQPELAQQQVEEPQPHEQRPDPWGINGPTADEQQAEGDKPQDEQP